MGCKIIGWGKALPELVVSNDDLAKIVDTSNEWIVERTGIHNRHISVNETTTDLASAAAEAALAKSGLAKEDIDLLICMTITPDAVVPSEACLVKMRLGLPNAIAFDLNAACSGCIYGLDVASSMIEASQGAGAGRRNPNKNARVVGVDSHSPNTDGTDPATGGLFGDGAGAAVVSWNETAPGILSSFLHNTDDTALVLACDTIFDESTFPFGPTDGPVLVKEVAGLVEDGEEVALHPFIEMQGQAVYKFATSAMTEAAQMACERAGVSIDDVACIVPHQANERIIRYAAKKMHVPMERFQVSIGEVGNTSASSVLMALADAYDSGRIHPGDKVLLAGFGGGLTYGSLLFVA